MKAMLVVLLLGLAASAQTPVPVPVPAPYPRPLSKVQEFLGLTDAQVSAILKNNDDYNRSAYEKQNRIRQVQAEIAEWTAAPILDPMELGIRYTEIENLCRQMKDAAVETQKKNLALLNDAQTAKLKVLNDAMKLGPVISEAQSASLLGNITTALYSFISGGTGSVITGVLLGGSISGCYVPGSGLPTVWDPLTANEKAARQ